MTTSNVHHEAAAPVEAQRVARQADDASVVLEFAQHVASLPREERERAWEEAKRAETLHLPDEEVPDDLDGFARPLGEFIAAKGNPKPPLVGTPDDNLQPAHGLTILVAKGGKGKTTLLVEKMLHLASGVDWLGFRVEHPLNLLVIENEGPREPFRHKLERRLRHWPHELRGEIYVYDEAWGSARLDDSAFLERLNRFIEAYSIDLVTGDPLDSLGMDGEGSPSETRKMVDRFKAAGLFDRVAWELLHHARKEAVNDAIDEASGAWGGRPDTMLGLEKLPGNKARLHFRKVRWGMRDGYTYRLGFDPETEAFTLEGEGTSEVRDLAAEITEYLASRPPSTTEEIAASREHARAGIGARPTDVRATLEENPDKFERLSVEEVKAAGRNAQAKLWRLVGGAREGLEIA